MNARPGRRRGRSLMPVIRCRWCCGICGLRRTAIWAGPTVTRTPRCWARSTRTSILTAITSWAGLSGRRRRARAATTWQALAQANPSKDHTEVTENCITERALMAALRTSPPHVFDMECMCRWVSLAGGGPFPEGAWAATLDNDATPAPVPSRPSVSRCPAGLRERTYVARAALDDEGRPVFGIWADQAGTDWVMDWLRANRSGYSVIVLRSGAGTPALSLLDQIEAAELPLEKWSAADVSAAHGLMFDAVRDDKTRHRSHPGLDMAATSAAIKVQAGGGWIIDPKNSPSDTAPLTAALGAVWGLGHLPDDRPSIYSGAAGVDVLVL
jgi:hypothetical protein